jgi:hypothetical protein
MPAARNRRFLDLVRKVPGFGFADELKELVERHGSDTPELLQAIIDARLLGKEEACRQWANALGFAYVDPFASIITEEIRTMISEGRSAQEITRTAAKIGYRPLRYDGLKKVLLGLTTIDEIEQNTSFEWAQ